MRFLRDEVSGTYLSLMWGPRSLLESGE
jgi:hypothetical protein